MLPLSQQHFILTVNAQLGNIRVFARIRPVFSDEQQANVDVLDDTTLVSSGKSYCFDKVFGFNSTQEEVFEEVKPLATSLLDGFNCCLFAYGQTGSGKTYTMEGPEDQRGINFRIMEELIGQSQNRHDVDYEFNISIYEIYNEQIIDLLRAPIEPSKNLKVRIGNNGAYVAEATTLRVNSISDIWTHIEEAKKLRRVSSTDMNERSSRSHCVTYLEVVGVNRTTASQTRSKLYLIDLAGSERASQTGACDKTLSESKHINKSLSALSRVMESLSHKKVHVPFRDSVLTFLLQDSLSGNSRTCMFIQLSPDEDSLSQTICTLKFGVRVKKIELGQAQKNLEIDKKALLELKAKIENQKKKLIQAQKTVDSKDDEISQMNIEIDKRNKLITTLRTELSEKKNTIAEHEGTIAAQQEEIERLKEQLMIQSMKSTVSKSHTVYSQSMDSSNQIDLLTGSHNIAPSFVNFAPSIPVERPTPPMSMSVPFTPRIKTRERTIGEGSAIKKRPITKTFTRIAFSSVKKQSQLKSCFMDKNKNSRLRKNVSFVGGETLEKPTDRKGLTTPMKMSLSQKFFQSDRMQTRSASKFVKTPLKDRNL